MAAAAAAFAAIAFDVATGGPLSALDRPLSDWFRGHAGTALGDSMRFVSTLHAPRGILAASVVVALILLWRRELRGLAMFVVAVAGGASLNAALKHTFEWPRPDFDGAALGATDFSFPSGHVANATLLYGAVALLVLPRLWGRVARTGVVAAAAAMVLLVAASRLVLGAHYPTDVIAAIAEGVAWLALVCRLAGDCR